MNKKYFARLSDEEREVCRDVIKRLKGSSQKVRRAQMLVKESLTTQAFDGDREECSGLRWISTARESSPHLRPIPHVLENTNEKFVLRRGQPNIRPRCHQ